MNRDERAAFGPRIRAERLRLGMSQGELAEAAGTTTRSIGSIERGDIVAQPAMLEKILVSLGLSPELDIATDDEVDMLIAIIQPFLAMLDKRHRSSAMRRLIEVLVREMRSQIAEESDEE